MKAKRVKAKQPLIDTKPWHTWALLGILLLTTIIYSNSLQNEFIYFDDPELVMDNVSIRQITWENTIHYFTTPFQFTYLPIGLLSYAIDYQIGELDPFIYHLNSLLIHLVCVVLAYLTFRQLTRKSSFALFIAFAFAIHPVNVDTVAWVATRNNLLATLFFLLSLWLYNLYLDHGFKTRYLALSVLAFALSALSKSSSVVLPLVFFLWDYYLGRAWTKRLLIEKIPFLLIALTLGILTLNIRTDVVPLVAYNVFDRIIIFCYALVNYLWRLLFPFQLSMSYAYPIKGGVWLPAYYYLSPFILALIVWGLYKLNITKKVLIVGLLFFLINISLSQSVLLIDNFMANRYAHLAYLGLFFILADIYEGLLSWRPALKSASLAVLVVFVTSFSLLTYDRNFVWHDTISLFDDVVEKQPDIPWVYSNRGVAKYRNGDYEQALQDFDRSLALDPNFALSRYYRGVISYTYGDYNSALADLDQTIVSVPDFAFAYNDRGKVKWALQDFQGALDDFSQTIALNDHFVEAYFNRGMLKNDLGDYQGAVADLSAAIDLNPQFADAYYHRGWGRNVLSDFQGAEADFSMAIQLYPSYPEAFYMRSIVKFNMNNISGSCSDAQTALSMGYQLASEQVNQTCS
jgi:tetratricopeptide (TPR) repeat protein